MPMFCINEKNCIWFVYIIVGRKGYIKCGHWLERCYTSASYWSNLLHPLFFHSGSIPRYRRRRPSSGWDDQTQWQRCGLCPRTWAARGQQYLRHWEMDLRRSNGWPARIIQHWPPRLQPEWELHLHWLPLLLSIPIRASQLRDYSHPEPEQDTILDRDFQQCAMDWP